MKLSDRSSSRVLMAITIGVSFYSVGISQAIAAEIIYFQVPSGNIHCGVSPSYLDCEIATSTAKLPAKPKDCNLDWGSRFGMALTGEAQRSCHGDTIGRDPKNPVLEYSKTLHEYGFTCTSKPTGLTCKNQDGHGWTLSKSKQQFF